jgi:hypothetical protein
MTSFALVHPINVENVKKSVALPANTNKEEPVDPFVRKLSLMTRKLLFPKTCFIVLLRELSSQKESF